MATTAPQADVASATTAALKRIVGSQEAVLFLAICLGIGLAQEKEEKKRGKKEQEIKVIKLDRKTPVLFDKEIEPILVNKCSFCHSGNVKEGKLDLSSYDTMMRGGKHGPAEPHWKRVGEMPWSRYW